MTLGDGVSVVGCDGGGGSTAAGGLTGSTGTVTVAVTVTVAAAGAAAGALPVPFEPVVTEVVVLVAAARAASGNSSEGSESDSALALGMSAKEWLSIPSARRRSALPLRLFAASILWRSRSSLSDGFSVLWGREATPLRDLEAPFRVDTPSSESSAVLPGEGDTDRELVLCRLAFSGFLHPCQHHSLYPCGERRTLHCRFFPVSGAWGQCRPPPWPPLLCWLQSPVSRLRPHRILPRGCSS